MNAKKCFPILSLIALLSGPSGYFFGAHYCHRKIWNQVNTAEYHSEDAKEDTQRFAALGVYLCTIVFGGIGAATGMLLAVLAHLRKEAWPWLRAIAFTANLCVVVLFLIYCVF